MLSFEKMTSYMDSKCRYDNLTLLYHSLALYKTKEYHRLQLLWYTEVRIHIFNRTIPSKVESLMLKKESVQIGLSIQSWR
jgi:hypothetical protein